MQSERLSIYSKHTIDLIESRQAYACFYSQERSQEIATSEIAKKSAAEFDKKFQTISPDEAKIRMQNETYVVRLKMPENGDMIIEDKVKGKLKFDYSLIEDPIIIKSDKYPTYHFANVIDDHLMKISHVIRGEEWLPSLPKHIHLYNCFNWDIPSFAHLPLLLNADKSKLSKRQGDVAVEDYRSKGYLKEALINFVALLGWHESNDNEFYLMDSLKESFSLDRVQTSGAVFDVSKLNWLNQKYIQKLDNQDIIEKIKPYINKEWKITPQMIDLIKDKLENFSDINKEIALFFHSPNITNADLVNQFPNNERLNEIINASVKYFSNIESFDKIVFNDIMKKIQLDANINGKDLWQPVRFILTGHNHGPDLASFISIIGIEECVQRFKNAV